MFAKGIASGDLEKRSTMMRQYHIPFIIGDSMIDVRMAVVILCSFHMICFESIGSLDITR